MHGEDSRETKGRQWGRAAEVEALAKAHPAPRSEVLLCPPATLLAQMAWKAKGGPVMVGGQDCHPEASGAHTGDIAAAMLKDAGASHVILGHSERRADHGETDALVRAKAEAENARRRAEDEVSKARKFGIESFAESLLPVADSLDAALAIQNATAQQLREGSDATLRQLTAALERNKVLAINPAAGDKFDPHQHQAISVVPADQEANTVVSVLQKGYLISERVLRPALVTVTAPK